MFRFKEELGLKPIFRYIGLASKVYCLQTACCHHFNKRDNRKCECERISYNGTKIKYSYKLGCKGASKFSMNEFTFNDYLSCLESQILKHVTDYGIVSKRQQLSTIFVEKVAFSGFNDKRFIFNCGIPSYPYEEGNSFECLAEECVNLI